PGEERGIRLLVLVAHEREAEAAPGFSPPRRPAGTLGRGREDRAGALVLEMSQPEGERVDPARVRQLVHEGLDREHVAVGAETPQRRGAERRLPAEVLDDAAGRGGVERGGASGGMRV